MVAGHSSLLSVRLFVFMQGPVRCRVVEPEMEQGMLKRHLRFTIALAAAVATQGVARAASVDGIDGNVMVNTGKGFKPVTAAVGLKPGDQVMAQPGGSALVTYDEACVVPVREGAVVTVKSKAPCPPRTNAAWKVENSTTTVETGSAGGQQVNPDAIQQGTPPNQTDAQSTAEGGDAQQTADGAEQTGGSEGGPQSALSPTAIAAGVAIAGGIGIGVYAATSSKSSSKPSSP